MRIDVGNLLNQNLTLLSYESSTLPTMYCHENVLANKLVSVDDDVDVEHCTIAALWSIGKASSGTKDICRHCSICRVQVPWSPRHTLRSHGEALLQGVLH